MNAASSPAPRLRPAPRRGQSGFTLLELLVAMVISLAIAGSLIILQAQMGQQGARTSDVASRDDQTRAAIEDISTSVGNAGFLFGGSQLPCNTVFTYNPAGVYAAHHAVDGLAATSGATVSFAPTLTLDYPPAGLASDVLVVSGTLDARRFTDSISAMQTVAPVTGSDPYNTGVIPVGATAALTGGDTAMLRIPDGPSATGVASKKSACFRIPMFIVDSGTLTVQANGTTMPVGNNFTSWAARMLADGYNGPLGNPLIWQGGLVDIGTVATGTQTTTVYFVSNNGGSYPLLMRNVYSMVDDSLISSTALAAGIVSMQVLYGVDPAGANMAVTEYDTAATVTANKYWDQVRSVKIWLVTRTLVDDPAAKATTGLKYGPITTIAAPTGFTAITVPTAPTDLRYRRFASQTVEIGLRTPWNSSILSLPYPP
jgi:type IV pilus assembly protein PilW